MVKKLSDFKAKHKVRNLNWSRHYSRERLKKATKRQCPCSLQVPWKDEFEN